MNELTIEDTKKQVIDIIADKLSTDASKINESITLKDLGADSLDVVEIIMQLEETFSIEIDDQKAEELKTVGEVIRYVDSLRKK